MIHRVSKLTIDLPATQHKRIKIAASMVGVTNRKFNKATEKALKQTEQRNGLKQFNTLDELFEDLGIY